MTIGGVPNIEVMSRPIIPNNVNLYKICRLFEIIIYLFQTNSLLKSVRKKSLSSEEPMKCDICKNVSVWIDYK